MPVREQRWQEQIWKRPCSGRILVPPPDRGVHAASTPNAKSYWRVRKPCGSRALKRRERRGPVSRRCQLLVVVSRCAPSYLADESGFSFPVRKTPTGGGWTRASELGPP